MAVVVVDSPITFLATFPDILTAIKIGQDGMRFQLDVPETEMGQAVRLLTLRDRPLRVTIVDAERAPVEGKTRHGRTKQD